MVPGVAQQLVQPRHRLLVRRLGELERSLLSKLDQGLNLLKANVQARELTVEKLVANRGPDLKVRRFVRFAIGG